MPPLGSSSPSSSPSFASLLLLSVSSSLDNAAIGLALGLRRRPLDWRFNVVISISNALGALVSAFVGARLGSFAPTLAGVLAGCLFLILAVAEIRGGTGEGMLGGAFSSSSGSSIREAYKLAIPMTLNNLAAGTAGGLAGAGPVNMCLAAAMASYALMFLGHLAGSSPIAARFVTGKLNSAVISAAIFGTLGVLQLLGAAGVGGL